MYSDLLRHKWNDCGHDSPPLQILNRRGEYLFFAPGIGKLRKRYHLQILYCNGIGKYLQVLVFDLYISGYTGVEIDTGKRYLPGIGSLTGSNVRDWNWNSGDLAVTVCYPHRNGSSVGGNDGNSNIPQGKPCVTGIGIDLDVTC